MMRVFLVGCDGMLGREVLGVLRGVGDEVLGVGRAELDICGLGGVLAQTAAFGPDVIVNCAAYTKVDACETERDTAFAVNAVGPKNLAVASDKLGVPVLHVSTDYVFDGEAGRPYLEHDRTNPQNIYGQSKLAGEEYVKSLTNKYFIVRTQWLYGKHGGNFVKTMLGLAAERDLLKVVDDQFGSPTYTKDLADAICRIVRTENFGIYHVTNFGACSWYEFTKNIFRIAGIKTQVNPCTTAEFPRPAKRPAYSVLDNFNMRLCGFPPMRGYLDALEDFLKEEFLKEDFLKADLPGGERA